MISQPAVSKYIRRLNDIAQEDLFIRKNDGLEPTASCLKLRDIAENILFHCGDFVNTLQDSFDPQAQASTFSIGHSIHKTQYIFKSLSADLANIYPKVSINLTHLHESYAIQSLSDETIDLYLGILPRDVPKYMEYIELANVNLRTVCSDKCPFFEKGYINKDEFISTPHIKMSITQKSSAIDLELKAAGLFQDTLIAVPDVYSVRNLLDRSPYLYVADESDALLMASQNPYLKVLSHDFSLPSFPWYAIWHRKNNSSPSHRWLREYIQSGIGAV